MSDTDIFSIIELTGHITEIPPICFLRAEIHKERQLPFVRVRYALYGEEQKDGLILDIHKMTFLDRVVNGESDKELNQIINKSASEIAVFVGSYISIH